MTDLSFSRDGDQNSERQLDQEEIEGISTKLLGNSSRQWCLTWTEVFQSDFDVEKFQLLFLWALLTQRWKLAEVFWVYGPEPIATALAAAIMLRNMANLLKDDGTREPTRKRLESKRRCNSFYA